MSVVRGTALVNYPGLVEELGGDAVQLLRRAGIRRADIGDYDVFVPLAGVVEALEGAAEATHTPDFGRRLARRQGIEILGPVGVAARTAATVGDAIAIFSTFMAAYSPAVSVSTAPVRGRADRTFLDWQILSPRVGPYPQGVELSLGVILNVLRFLLGASYVPLSVHVPNDALTPAATYRDYFGCRPRFGEPAAGFTLPTADLGRPLSQDALAHRALVDYLTGLIGPRGSDTSQSVRTIVRRLLPTGAAKLEVVAAQFNLHPKTLQRRLAEEGTTFFGLVDEVRRDTAEHYLRETDIDLSHLTRELGYTEQSVLTRSCKRWFGTGPLAHRRAERARVRPAVSALVRG
jgi:AraC-like DNA-binding protein